MLVHQILLVRMNDTSDYDKHITEAVFRFVRYRHFVCTWYRYTKIFVYHNHIREDLFRCRTVSALCTGIPELLSIITI